MSHTADGGVHFKNCSHLTKTTTLVYVAEEHAEAGKGEQVSPKSEKMFQSQVEREFKDDCDRWTSVSLRLEPTIEPLVKVQWLRERHCGWWEGTMHLYWGGAELAEYCLARIFQPASHEAIPRGLVQKVQTCRSVW
jgi:hypothetical protein